MTMKYIFLDFDGVMHIPGNYHPKFEHMDIFCESLQPYLRKFQIIISSSWREVYSFEELKDLFPEFIQSHIVDITPVLWSQKYQRYQEVLTWCRKYSVDTKDILILDDMAELFPQDCFELLLIDNKKGLTCEDLQKILVFMEDEHDT